MHVDAIVVSTVSVGGGNKKGRAVVTIKDDLGGLVASADVTGTFTGDFNETVEATTNGSGVATLDTVGTKKGGVHFEFCVDGVVHATLTYAPGDNVITCASL